MVEASNRVRPVPMMLGEMGVEEGPVGAEPKAEIVNVGNVTNVTTEMAVGRTVSKRTESRAAGTAGDIGLRATPVQAVEARMMIILGIAEVAPLLIEPFQ